MAYGTNEDIEKIFKPEYDILASMDLFLQSENINLIEQIFWFFGNAMGESREIRDLLLSKTCIFDVLEKLVFSRKIT